MSARIATLRLAETFTISRESHDEAEVVQVEVEHDGRTGFGEAAPIERYDESAESALAYLEAQSDALGDDPFALDEIFDRLHGSSSRPAPRSTQRCTTSRASSSTCPCIGCSASGVRARRRRGRSGSAIPTTWRGARRRRPPKGVSGASSSSSAPGTASTSSGFARCAASTDLPLQVDVNEYWTLDEALEYLPQMDIQYCEQPLPAGSDEGVELKRRSPVPIYVDEDCHTLDDVARCAEIGARDQHQAREVGRDPRSGAHGARGTRARPGRDARLHDRVRARHRARRAHLVALRPRRSRRQPPARGRSVARGRARGWRSASVHDPGTRCQALGT